MPRAHLPSLCISIPIRAVEGHFYALLSLLLPSTARAPLALTELRANGNRDSKLAGLLLLLVLCGLINSPMDKPDEGLLPFLFTQRTRERIRIAIYDG